MRLTVTDNDRDASNARPRPKAGLAGSDLLLALPDPFRLGAGSLILRLFQLDHERCESPSGDLTLPKARDCWLRSHGTSAASALRGLHLPGVAELQEEGAALLREGGLCIAAVGVGIAEEEDSLGIDLIREEELVEEVAAAGVCLE